jgi:hypothetical protein
MNKLTKPKPSCRLQKVLCSHLRSHLDLSSPHIFPPSGLLSVPQIVQSVSTLWSSLKWFYLLGIHLFLIVHCCFLFLTFKSQLSYISHVFCYWDKYLRKTSYSGKDFFWLRGFSQWLADSISLAKHHGGEALWWRLLTSWWLGSREKKGPGITFEATPPVTYFLQSGPTS